MTHTLRTRLGAGVIALVVALTALAACGRGEAANQERVTLLVSTLNNPFFVDVRDGAQAEAEELGVQVLVSDAQNDAANQLNQAQNARAMGSNAVIINPVDSDTAAQVIKPLVDVSIPVISVDRAINGAEVNSHVASDNVAGGRQAAEELAARIGGTGKVIVLEGVPGTSAARDRGQGFSEGIAAFPDIEVVATQTANFDRAQGLDVATNLLQANPDVVGIFAQNDEMALGAIQAVGAKAGKEIFIVGFDGTDEGLVAVQAGTMAATIAQQPEELGRVSLRTAVALFRGQEVEAVVDVPVMTVNQDNISDFLQ